MISLFINCNNTSLVLGGVTTFGIPNLTPFSFISKFQLKLLNINIMTKSLDDNNYFKDKQIIDDIINNIINAKVFFY